MSITPSVAVDTIKKPPMPTSNGNTLYVGGTGPNNYTKIQDAIDNASNGDMVFVYNDSSPYYEHIWINKSINLIGENRDTTVIDGSEIENVVYIDANWVILRGFTIQNSGTLDPFDAGIKLNSSSHCIISHNILTHNSEGITTTSLCEDKLNKHNIISNNIIRNNHYNQWSWTGNGIGLYLSFHAIITENTFVNNHNGIYISGSLYNIISKNNITFSTETGITISILSIFNIVKNNNFIGNKQNADFHRIFFMPLFTRWYRNYWDDWIGIGPKPITGKILIPYYRPEYGPEGGDTIEIPRVNFDLRPARKPYNIDTAQGCDIV